MSKDLGLWIDGWGCRNVRNLDGRCDMSQHRDLEPSMSGPLIAIEDWENEGGHLREQGGPIDERR